MAAEPRIAFYGDDFTGSTDAAECLAFAGLNTILFLDPPTPEVVERYPGLEAIGVAGASRTMTPDEMDDHLPVILAALRDTSAPVVHYKTCSTFDSAPGVGSIGHVMDIADEVLPQSVRPIVAGAPSLGRYMVFGNLFARAGLDGEVFRLDRHPTMSRHPITPMDEADIRLHLRRQAEHSIASFDFRQCAGSFADVSARLADLLATGPDAILFDVIDDPQLTVVGGLIDALARRHGQVFAVGSSGVEYALTQWWAQEGRLPSAQRRRPIAPVDQIFAISGSASPVTAGQIDAALAAGFAEIAIDPVALTESGPDGVRAVSASVVQLINDGRSVVAHTSHGPQDPRVAKMLDAQRRRGTADEDTRIVAGRVLSMSLGNVLKNVLAETKLSRVLVAGGDTSSHAARALDLEALEIVTPIAPGGPLCRALAPGKPVHGLELVLKGGQVGGRDFFKIARDGRHHGSDIWPS